MIVRKTYAEFLHPDEEKTGEVAFSLREMAYGDRNPAVLPGPPADALGVRFFDQVEAWVEDPKTKKQIRCLSPRLDVDQGVTFYKGVVLTSNDIASGIDTIPRRESLMVRGVMERHGWKKVIYFSDCSSILPFSDVEDKLFTT